MVRKQLYITEEQEEALKKASGKTQIPETQVIRLILDEFFGIKKPETNKMEEIKKVI